MEKACTVLYIPAHGPYKESYLYRACPEICPPPSRRAHPEEKRSVFYARPRVLKKRRSVLSPGSRMHKDPVRSLRQCRNYTHTGFCPVRIRLKRRFFLFWIPPEKGFPAREPRNPCGKGSGTPWLLSELQRQNSALPRFCWRQIKPDSRCGYLIHSVFS